MGTSCSICQPLSANCSEAHSGLVLECCSNSEMRIGPLCGVRVQMSCFPRRGSVQYITNSAGLCGDLFPPCSSPRSPPGRHRRVENRISRCAQPRSRQPTPPVLRLYLFRFSPSPFLDDVNRRRSLLLTSTCLECCIGVQKEK